MNIEELKKEFNELKRSLMLENIERQKLVNDFNRASYAIQEHKRRVAPTQNRIVEIKNILENYKINNPKPQKLLKPVNQAKLDKLAEIDDLTKKEALRILSTSSKKSCSLANFKPILQYQCSRPNASVDRVLDAENGKLWLIAGDTVLLL